MSDYQMMNKDKLKELVAETQATLVEINAEIERRERASQEQEIENLDVHLKNAELSLQTIRNFFVYLLEEIRKK